MEQIKKSITLPVLIFYLLINPISACTVESFGEVSEQINSWQQPQESDLTEDRNFLPPAENLNSTDKAKDEAKLTIIDKKNGKVNHLTIAVGSSTTYESLIINVHQCLQEELRRYNRENKALLEIFNINKGTSAERRFYGWMFSNSPESSVFIHERFDVTLATCGE